MSHRYCLLICLAVTVAVPSCAAQRRAAQSTPLNLPAVTAASRSTIDAIAAKAPAPTVEQRQSELFGSVTGWLVSQSPLSPQEERDLATAVHAEIVKSTRVLPTPPEAQVVLGRLVAELPARLRPDAFQFQLTVLDEPGTRTFATGGGYLYMTGPCLNAILADAPRAPDLLAFALATDLGHTCLGHCRRGYQLLKIQEQLKQEGSRSIDLSKLAQALETGVDVTGAIVRFSFTAGQTYASDLFALHLCRNAAFDQERALDLLRGAVAAQQPAVLAGEAPVGGPASAAVAPGPLLRLASLKAELNGTAPAGPYGIFAYDRNTGALNPAPDHAIPQGRKAVVLIHGMDSSLETWRTLMAAMATRPSMQNMDILGFQYPNDGSLARAGLLLKREVARVCDSAEYVDFICHSAGGLVFRYYAAVEQGAYHRALFAGTPHTGSSFARLRPVLESQRFVGDLKLGYSAALERLITDGRGQIALDLEPDSLFLRYLNRHSMSVDRCAVVRGQALSQSQLLVLQLAMTAARNTLQESLASPSEGGTIRTIAARSVDALKVPDEIAGGDLVVSADSAALQGVSRIRTFPLNHVQLTGDADVVRFVLNALYP